VVSAGNHYEQLPLHAINESMGVINAPRPEPREVLFQWLGLANAMERLSKRVSNEGVNPL
jgi:hypothetical protein